MIHDTENKDNDAWLREGSKKPFRMYYILAGFSFVLFTPPEGLAYTSVSFVRNIWWVALSANCIVLLLAFIFRSSRGKGKKIDSVILLAMLAFLPMAFFTITNEGSLLFLSKKAIFIFGPWLFLAVFGEYGFRPLLKVMLVGSMLIALANIISIFLMYSQGSFRPEYGDTWLFSQRTHMRNFLLPCLLFCMLSDKLNNVKCSFMTISMLVVSFISVVIADAMTTLVVLLLITSIVVLFRGGSRRTPVFRFFLFGFTFLDVIIVHVRNIEIFRGLIEGLLNRNMTLSYRTQAWDIALDYIKNNPFVGTGINKLDSSGIVVGFGKQLSNVHNQILDVWFKGGILSLIFFVALVARCIIPLLKNTRLWVTFAMGVFVGGFFIEAIVGDVWYPQFFLLLYLSAYIYYWGPIFEKGEN